MTSVLTGWLLALLLGMRHASEPDHLAAVSTLLAEHPHAHPHRSAWLGAFWGLGHSLALLGVGGVLLLLHLRMPGQVADLFELGVAAMLLVVGARSLRRAVQTGRSGRSALHTHHGTAHVHEGPADHLHVGRWTMARRPLMIGLVHGMAGSGALTALALASMPSLGSGLVYMLLFGAGSSLGMALLTGLAGWPLRQLAQRAHVQIALSGLAGVISLVLGVLWGWPLLLRLTGA
jgi:high-affinity nickel permease